MAVKLTPSGKRGGTIIKSSTPSVPIEEMKEPEEVTSPDQAEHLTSGQAVELMKKETYSFLTGVAGSGKTYTVREWLRKDPLALKMTATTGIAAVNLGVETINSCLRFFNTESLQNRYLGLSGRSKPLKLIFRGLAAQYGGLLIDEISMMDGVQLEIISTCVGELNLEREMEGEKPFKLILTGDPLQLPPVDGKWFFEVRAWDKFKDHQIKLTRVWRQKDEKFLEALNAIRVGNGVKGARILKELGVEFATSAKMDFGGTTLFPKNDKVDLYNQIKTTELPGLGEIAKARKWSHSDKPPGDWKNIKDIQEVKLGQYVMILTNGQPDPITREYPYVNGDCGWITEIGKDDGEVEWVRIRLARNESQVMIGKLLRNNKVPEIPYGYSERDLMVLKKDDVAEYMEGKIQFDSVEKRYIDAQIEYLPIRPAYATSIHKSQGLTLDSVQIDINPTFFGFPAMAYVALSRCKGPEGLRIIGTPEMLAKRVKMEKKVKDFV